MAFRRRRKPRVIWLPQPGTLTSSAQGLAPEPEGHWAGINFNSVVDGNADPVTFAAPMVIDNPSSTSTGTFASWQASGLQEKQEFGYRLRRIVGDLQVAFAAAPEDTQATVPLCGALVEVGIIVRRVDADGQPAVDGVDQDVGSIQNNSDPWVWRRNWYLSSGSTVTPAAGAASHAYWMSQFYPISNWGYGNSRQQVDQKTARRVGPEERLFLNVTTWPMPMARSDITFNGKGILEVTFDYRVLATLAINSGNRRNASR